MYLSLLVLVSWLSLSESMLDRRFPKQRYCAIHSNHTLCLYQNSVSPRCGEVVERGLSVSERQEVVRLHNERRSFIAQGREARGDPGPQPEAANMMELTYDEELEFEAQSWADQCVRDHECPRCRTLDRFKVGQNLFWFGHFTGSWEKSVRGWYDEVVDFNSSFVYPFYVIPGVLVGHFTQMTWAQTTKIGCGKLFSYPDRERSPFGQQFFICNYGLAGNLIKSEMYRVGPPCSSCPPGTTCSRDYPGLCSGVPDRPLTIRPPKFDHDFGLGIRTPRPQQVEFVPGEAVTLPTIVVSPPPAPKGPEKCSYSCKANGGCSVKFVSPTPFFSGSVLGSCFPPDFGGECSGTPKKCRDCLGVCGGGDRNKGMRLTFELDEDGNPKSPPEVTRLASSSSTSSSTSTSSGKKTCTYSCQSSGACSVRVNAGGALISGSVLGSCFSPGFGGSCSGTPDGCRDCLPVCQESGGEKEELVLPATS